MQDYQLISNFMDSEEAGETLQLIQSKDHLFAETSGSGTLRPRYRVIDGDTIRAHLPEVEAFGENRVRPSIERLAGGPLELMNSPKRSMRIQAYVSKDHSFRWHLDTQAYVALVCLINTNGGQTCMVSPAITRLLRPLRYPLYPFPQVFDLLPCEKITLQAGDMLFMRGSRMLHRAVTADEEGERMLIVFAYDPPDKKQNPLMEMMVRRINF